MSGGFCVAARAQATVGEYEKFELTFPYTTSLTLQNLAPEQCDQTTCEGAAPTQAIMTVHELQGDRWAKAGTLIDPDQYCDQFPSIPGVACNGLYKGSGERDFGLGVIGNRGVIDKLIPDVLSGHKVLVPKVDEIGNDVAGIHHPFVEAPIPTLTGWNLRTPEFTDGDFS